MSRERRIAQNELLFREVNERIQELRGDWGDDDLSVVCECANAGCAERIPIPPSDYAAVRRNRRRFVVRPGHELPDVEDVVARVEGYVVVEKRADPEELAAG